MFVIFDSSWLGKRGQDGGRAEGEIEREDEERRKKK